MGENYKDALEIINQQIKVLASIYHGAAAKFGVSDSEFWVWYALLVLEGEYSQQDICEMWSLPKQTVNSVVSNLIKKGYVSLKAVRGARNRKVICLSEQGEEYGRKIVMKIHNAELRTIDRMTEEEKKTCIELVGKYIDILREEINEDEIE